MSSIANEIMIALNNISYMDVLNITNLILEYDDADNKFIKDKTNTMIYIGVDRKEGDTDSTSYHIDIKDQIYQSYNYYDHSSYHEKTKKLKNLRHYKQIHGDSFELVDISISDIIIHLDDVYKALIPSDEDKFYVDFYVGLDYKNLPCVQLHFRYILCDNDGEVEETENERDLRFNIFLEKSEKNLNRWMQRL